MKSMKKLSLLLAMLLVFASLFTGCDVISSEDASELISLAGEVISGYTEGTDSAADSVAGALAEAGKSLAGEVADTVKDAVGEDVVDAVTEAGKALIEDATPAVDTVKGVVEEKVGEALTAAEEAITTQVVPAIHDAAEAVVSASEPAATAEPAKEEGASVVYGQAYYDKDSVAAYLHEFGELPPNYLTKKEAQALGWEASKGNLWKVTDKGCIGGDHFGNYEGKLPTAKGRKYYECDVEYAGGFRGSDRLIFSNDGLIYYTGDHYNTFTLLYGEE